MRTPSFAVTGSQSAGATQSDSKNWLKPNFYRKNILTNRLYTF